LIPQNDRANLPVRTPNISARFLRENLKPYLFNFPTALAKLRQISQLIRLPRAQLTMSTIGIPIKLLHESQGHIVTVELTNGQVYRGKLLEGTPPLP